MTALPARSAHRSLYTSAIALLLACNGDGSDGASEGTATAATATDTATGGGDTTGAGDTAPTGGDDSAGEESTGATTDPGESGADESSFIDMPDGGNGGGECDVWAQDCPAGEKCTPALVNGVVASKCVPVDANPGQVGDPCTRDDMTGEDSCDVGVLCVPDPDPDLMRCFALCSGSASEPVCPGSKDECVIADGGATPICFPTCDPLLQDCGILGWGCFPSNGGYVCAPDQSAGANTQGSACGPSLNTCAAGLLCSGNVGGCANLCCTPYCDLAAADPNAACPGVADGEECLAVYDPPPPGFDTVGICNIPT